MRVFLIAIALLLMGAGTIPEDAVKTGGKYLYVREATNSNDHPMITKWLGEIGLPPGLPWCAAYVVGMYREAATAKGAKNPLPKYGRVSLLYTYAKANPGRYKLITPTMLVSGAEKAKPGDVVIWLYGTGPNPNGHTGLTRGQSSNYELLTREGNTQPGEAGDQREGGGVYDRSRYLPNIKAIIRVRLP